MAESGVVAVLRNMPFLQEVSDDLIAKLAESAKIVEFPKGSVVFRQGDPARSIYLVVEGMVALEICAPAVGCKRILTLGPSELLGWSPVLGEETFTATARTLQPTRVVEIEGAHADICRLDPKLGYEFMKCVALALAKRLNATRLQLLDVYGPQIPEIPDDRAACQKD